MAATGIGTGSSVAKKQFPGPKKRPTSSAGRSPAGRNGHGSNNTGLNIETAFCPPDVADPFETVEWDLRTAAIKGESRARCSSSRPIAKCPPIWSQLATNVVVSKYFYGEINTPERETACGS